VIRSGTTAAAAMRPPCQVTHRILRAVAVLGLTALAGACTAGTAPQASPGGTTKPGTIATTASPRTLATASPPTGPEDVTTSISQSLVIADDQPSNQAPGFFEGSRLLAAVAIAGGTRPRSIWFTPTSTQLRLEAFGGCNSDADTTPTLSFRVLVNDHVAMTDRCTGDNDDTAGPAATDWSDGPTNVWSTSLGVHVGHPAKLTVQYLHPTGHAVGTFAVYQQVPPAHYQFPPPPAHLALPPPDSRGILLDARRTGANGTFTLVARVGEQLRLTTAAPGQLTISCGPHQRFGVASWYYKPYNMDIAVSSLGIGGTCPTTGQPTIQLTVAASRFASPGWIITDSSDPERPLLQPDPTR
jgi:hypothetical protein